MQGFWICSGLSNLLVDFKQGMVHLLGIYVTLFVLQFAQLEHAKAAQSALNGKLEIVGRTLKVCFEI